jgi:hypothetical protein
VPAQQASPARQQIPPQQARSAAQHETLQQVLEVALLQGRTRRVPSRSLPSQQKSTPWRYVSWQTPASQQSTPFAQHDSSGLPGMFFRFRHGVVPGWHGEETQAPFMQIWSSLHASPQRPQLKTSEVVSVELPKQQR